MFNLSLADDREDFDDDNDVADRVSSLELILNWVRPRKLLDQAFPDARVVLQARVFPSEHLQKLQYFVKELASRSLHTIIKKKR